jgi:hypothetical protein
MSVNKNRFAALLDNNNDVRNFKNNVESKDRCEKKSNEFKLQANNNNHDLNNKRSLYKDHYYNDNKSNHFLKKDIIEEKTHTYNAIENKIDFPVLLENKIQKELSIEDGKNIDFLTALNNNEVKIEKITKKIQDGWVIRRFDNENRKIIKEYGKNTYISKTLNSMELMEMIVNKYEEWKKRYIDTWGEDQYEKIYKFPNYDYGYFDTLDEKYEEEMAIYYRENNYDSSCSNSDYETNDDYYE